MIQQTFANPSSQPFPVDQTTIYTTFRLLEVVGECKESNLNTLPPHIRPLIHSISPYAKPAAGNRPTIDHSIHPRYNPDVPCRIIKVDGFDPIRLHADKEPGCGWVVRRIDFNPGHLVNGHNGRILTEESFLHALSVLLHLLRPLLADENDWIHIVPGLDPCGLAYWHKPEIAFHVLDNDGAILDAYSRAKHQEINKEPLYKVHSQSIAFGNSQQTLIVRVYCKDIQMHKKRLKPTHIAPVLRIEVVLSKDKLIQHFQGGRWKLIDGARRLVSFHSSDLRAAHFSVMSGFSGVYAATPSAHGEGDHKLGRHMAWVATITDLPVQRQIIHHCQRHLASVSVKSLRNAKYKLGKGARRELALLSPVKLAGLFGEGAWSHQPHVIVEKLETMTQARHMDIRIHPAVVAAYGSYAVTNA